MTEKTMYEVWSISGNPMTRHLISDDPVEIVYFIRKHPVGERWFKVHPRGDGFHQDAKIAYDFVSIHRMAVADDIIRKAFKTRKPEGLAKELNDLFFGR